LHSHVREGSAIAARALNDDGLAVLIAGVAITWAIRDRTDDGACAGTDRSADQGAFDITGGHCANRCAETAADSRAGTDVAFLLRAGRQSKRRDTGDSHFPEHFFTSL
jgi:hypothetical protein